MPIDTFCRGNSQSDIILVKIISNYTLHSIKTYYLFELNYFYQIHAF